MAVVAVAVVAVAVGVYAATRTVSVPGQKLGDISPQTAKEGEPRLIVWGIVRPIGGNIVAVQEPPRIERRKQKSGGKGGGGGSSSTSEHPHRTYAIAICEGPITGIRRVWRNNKLIFDGRPGSSWGAKNNHVFTRTARFFMGGFNQMPSPDLEKVFGVGNVPAMRGTAYMVMADEDLSDMGGAVPQWLFEVVRAEGFSVTSKLYAIDIQEPIAASVGSEDGRLHRVGHLAELDEQAGASLTVVSAELRSIVIEQEIQEEAVSTLEVVNGELQSIVIEVPTEESANSTLELLGGTLLRTVVATEFEYQLASSLEVVSAELTPK